MSSDEPLEYQCAREPQSEVRLLEVIRWLYAGWDFLVPPLADRLPEKPVPLWTVAHLLDKAPALPPQPPGDSKDSVIKMLLDIIAKQTAALKPEPRELSAGERRKIYDRSRKRTLPPDWPERRQKVFERDGFKCVYCGASECRLHCDHVIALSCGGSHELSNLVTACGPCNIKKNNRPAAEFVGGVS